MRNVKMHFNAEERCNCSRHTSELEFMAAIGYLSLWALDAYTELNLYLLSDGEIVASYRSDHEGVYEIHGIPSDDGTYHFHS